jgi:hypothetical protein
MCDTYSWLNYYHFMKDFVMIFVVWLQQRCTTVGSRAVLLMFRMMMSIFADSDSYNSIFFSDK